MPVQVYATWRENYFILAIPSILNSLRHNISIIQFHFMIKKLSLIFVYILVLNVVSSQSCQCDPASCQAETISVIGNAQVQIAPDFATVVIRAEVTRTTSSLALSALANRIQSIIGVLSALSIPAADYSTQNLFLAPQYDFSTGTGVVVGQTASQEVKVIVRTIVPATTLENLIDNLVNIGGVTINGISFDKTDKTLALRTARQAAYNNAVAKAQQYASLSLKPNRRVIKIEDGGQDRYTSGFFDAQIPVAGSKSIVFVRKVTVSATVQVKFAISATVPALPSGPCFNNQKNIQVGQGSVSANPNIAILTLTVEKTATTSANAILNANIQINAIKTVLASRGVAAADIQTTSFTIFPKYQFFTDGSAPLIIGYTASHTIQVTIRSIGTLGSSLGPLIDAVAAVGNGLIVQGIRFDIADKTALFASARAAAFNDAKDKANQYSTFSATTLGAVVTVNEGDFQPTVVPVAQFAAAKASTVIIAAALEFTASVTVTFAFV